MRERDVPSAPSRFEVEHLHRLMIQASVEAAQLDQRLDEARNADSLWPVLRHWSEAAEALDDAVERAGPALQREGTPKDQIDRIRERLDHLEQRSRQFDLDFDLDECVETWRSFGHDLAQLSGRHRDVLVLLLRHHQPAIDQATAMLSEAQRHEGLLREQHRKVVALQTDRDRARARYERLRQSHLAAQHEWGRAAGDGCADPRTAARSEEAAPSRSARASERAAVAADRPAAGPETVLVRGASDPRGPAGKAAAAPLARTRPPAAQRGRRPAGEDAFAPRHRLAPHVDGSRRRAAARPPRADGFGPRATARQGPRGAARGGPRRELDPAADACHRRTRGWRVAHRRVPGADRGAQGRAAAHRPRAARRRALAQWRDGAERAGAEAASRAWSVGDGAPRRRTPGSARGARRRLRP